MDKTNNFSISDELAGNDFGDKRLNNRMAKLVEAAARRPGHSFPEITHSVSALEATYRFLANPKVTPEIILTGHVEATVGRGIEAPRLIIAHDTTEFLFGGKQPREGLGWLNAGGQGFFAHFALALSRAETVTPLGVLGFEALFRTGKRGEGKNLRNGKANHKRESLRWWNLVDKTQSLFPIGTSPIHVMDREADDFELFSDLCSQDIRFVIRIRQNRSFCQTSENSEKEKLFALLQGLEVICERDVVLSRRDRGRLPNQRKMHPARASRVAKLHIKAATIQVPRPDHLPGNFNLADSLTLNCIHVYEVNTPKEAEPVDWKLFTKESVATPEDILKVIDDYRSRWTIEEYFKALKTGCGYEKRQLESKDSLLNALAIFAPIAWQLLLLKTLNRDHPDSPAEYALTKPQIAVLRAVSKQELSQSPTISQAIMAIAALGGHIPNNGAPGWIVLGRGMETLLIMEIAWMARERCDQS